MSDIIVGAPGEDIGPLVDSGRVYLFSGATGARLRTLETPDAYQEDESLFGYDVADAGDTNGDGAPDLIVGAISHGPTDVDNGRAFVLSATTGQMLRTTTTVDPGQTFNGYGRTVSGAGDLDGDGHDEFVVAEDSFTYLYDGATGALIRLLDLPGDPPGTSFGATAFARLDDLTGDGVGELAAATGGHTYTFDLTTGAAVHVALNPTPSNFENRPQQLAAVGDADGDGVTDFSRGVPFARVQPDQSRLGALYIYSGATGALLLDVLPPTSEGRAFGAAVAAVGDLDGDGAADVLATVPFPFDAPRVVALSGATGAVLGEIVSPFEPETGVIDVVTLRPADGGPAGAIVAVSWSGRYAAETQSRRRVLVYRFGGTVDALPAPAVPALALSVAPSPSAGAARAVVAVSSPGHVRVAVVDALGRTVAVAHDGALGAGSHDLRLGGSLPAGVYAVVAESGGGRAVARWVVVP